MNDSKTKTTRRNYGDTAKTRTKATAKAQGTAPKTPPKATKKPSAKELNAARKLLASQNPLVEAQNILQAGGCTGTLVAGRTPAGTDFVYLDPMHRQTRAMVRKEMRDDADRQRGPEDLRDPGSVRIGAADRSFER